MINNTTIDAFVNVVHQSIKNNIPTCPTMDCINTINNWYYLNNSILLIGGVFFALYIYYLKRDKESKTFYLYLEYCMYLVLQVWLSLACFNGLALSGWATQNSDVIYNKFGYYGDNSYSLNCPSVNCFGNSQIRSVLLILFVVQTVIGVFFLFRKDFNLCVYPMSPIKELIKELKEAKK